MTSNQIKSNQKQSNGRALPWLPKTTSMRSPVHVVALRIYWLVFRGGLRCGFLRGVWCFDRRFDKFAIYTIYRAEPQPQKNAARV